MSLRKFLLVYISSLTILALSIYGAFIFAVERGYKKSGNYLFNRTAISFRVDNNFTPKEREIILDVFKEIKNVSKCIELKAYFDDIHPKEVLSWREDDKATIYRASNPISWVYYMARRLAGPGSFAGLSFIKTGDIFIMLEEGGDLEFRNTITHEVLHVLFSSGWHSPDKRSLMYYIIDGDQQLLTEERDILRELCS